MDIGNSVSEPDDAPPADTGSAILDSVLATVPDAIVVIDGRGTILSFSRAAERMFGLRECEAVGTGVDMLLATGAPAIIGAGRVATGRRRDGSTFPIELR